LEFTIHPELPALDINRAAAWYREKLGLEPVLHGNEPIEPGTTHFDSELLYDTGTARFGVYESKHAGKNLATAARLVTQDFDSAHAELLANGVVFEIYDIEEHFHEDAGTPYWDQGALVFPDGEKTAWFKDSEGNILAIGST
jgi:catechol 2,3-dioxygenase-like lactoylglutathione lyase family enzyme